jgi:hypothetical protein
MSALHESFKTLCVPDEQSERCVGVSMLEPGQTTMVLQRFDYLPAYASSPIHKYMGAGS